MPIRFLSVVFALLVCTKTCSSSTTSNSEAPWQWKESRTSIVEEATYGDMPATVFSPTGRLYSVESNVKLASSSGNLILAVNCNDGIVILSTMILSPYLNETLFLVDKQPFQYITELSPNLMGATAGNGIDNAVFLNTMHKTCQHLLQQGSDENCALLARQLADQLQVPTQTLGKSKLLASFGIIVGNQELWRLDPTGQFWKCQALACGKYGDQAERELYSRLSDGGKEVCSELEKLSTDEALTLLLNCMETVIHSAQTTPGINHSEKRTYWQAAIQPHHSSEQQPSSPIRKFQRGAFVPKTPTLTTTSSNKEENDNDANEEHNQ